MFHYWSCSLSFISFLWITSYFCLIVIWDSYIVNFFSAFCEAVQRNYSKLVHRNLFLDTSSSFFIFLVILIPLETDIVGSLWTVMFRNELDQRHFLCSERSELLADLRSFSYVTNLVSIVQMVPWVSFTISFLFFLLFLCFPHFSFS